ncbi:GNAT family N-acetyltransferase [Shewanella sp. SR44-3]|uniref:GNAT family N-acetyltransferase n=1 Tax=Shewanella sp. SR44-3 TaxID=2760936 RepID=UPI0015F9DDBD|nr:GNAT family N-acetyltransferase [Shewanella sp. SR44-3]MBB1271046.1 N-acetyltransferase [Shewanella sp. SR44-3]
MSLQISLVNDISQIGPQAWHALFGLGHPFTRYEYLHALETSGACSAKTGWQPRHLVVTKKDTAVAESAHDAAAKPDNIIALMPLYEKHHSYGEYVFDWAWADAYEHHGVAYYPKLLCAIPFTPATGTRLAMDSSLDDGQQDAVWTVVVDFLQQQIMTQGYSSWHCLFTNAAQSAALAQTHLTSPSQTQVSRAQANQPESNQIQANSQTFAIKGQPIARLGTQFHWFNRGYSQFDDCLQAMTSRKRKNIQKERAAISKFELSFEFIHGDNITSSHWRSFSLCYQQTYLKRSGHTGYLNSDFFQTIGTSMADAIRLLRVSDASGNDIAYALYFVSKNRLYGRYWGAFEDIPGLHFEACYYQGIEYAIAQGLSCFDAGAQGEHKVLRGFEPIETHSFHSIAHEGFKGAIQDYCQQESRNMQLYMAEQAKNLPYKSSQ